MSFWRTLLIPCLISVSVWAEPVIKEIQVKGNRKIETDAIRTKIQSKIGSTVQTDRINRDIRAIFGLGYFDHIEVAEEDVSGGVRLIYEVTEKATVTEIVFKGLDELDEEEAKGELEFKAYEVLDIHKINVSIEKLLAKYEEKGHYLADIQFEIERDKAKNQTTVIFNVQENDQIRVKRVNIIGASALDPIDLKKVMQTQEGGPFSWITGSGTFRQSVFERDIGNLQYYYGTFGYVRASFSKPEVTVSPDKRWVYITFSVVEGEKYFVGKVDFRGELLFTRERLFSDLKLKEGEVFNTDTLRRETLRYTEMYGDLGYAFANVVPQPTIHDDTRKVDVVFDVDKGQRVFVGRITITGNTRTKDRVIRRQLKIKEGQLFSGTRKRQSRENVVRLGFFENVEFHQTTSKQASDVVDLEVRVKERSTGQLVIGAGYASGNIGFTAQAQLSQNNFLGNGQVASLSAQVLTGQNVYDFNVSFFEPYVGFSNWSLGGDFFHQQRKVFAINSVPTFVETKTGAAIKMGHPVQEYTNLFLTYKLEHSYVPVGTLIDQDLIKLETLNGYASILSANLVYDRRDDRFDPKNGWYWSLTSDFAGLGGSRKWWKKRVTTKFFHPLFWDLVFRMNFTAANVSRVGKNVPINELFLQGGLFSLRGYEHLSVGPKANLSSNPAALSKEARDKNLAGRSIPLGGHNEVLLNVEVEFPLIKEARIRGVVFFDTGNAFNGFFEGTKPALLASAGWGLRWFTPIGPLRFEFGYPIVNPGKPEFYFTIGPPF